MTVDADAEPQFGEPVPCLTYIDRPGAYALVFHDSLLLVVETPAGYFLPGGGIDAGESPEDALRREVLEEAGLLIGDISELGTARQYVIDAATGIGYNKIETFFHVTTFAANSQPLEFDHTARWVSVVNAIAGLREPAQVWSVRAALRLP